MSHDTDPRCDTCGHRHSSHVWTHEGGPEATGCQVRRATEWDDKLKTFGRVEKCTCQLFHGQIPATVEVTKLACPHEVTEESRHCVHRNEVVPKKKAMK